MNASITIEEFSTLLELKQDKNTWLEALRKLSGLEEPKTVIEAIGPGPQGSWA